MNHRLALAAALVAGSCSPVASTGAPEPHVAPTDRRGARAAASRSRPAPGTGAAALTTTTVPPVTTTTAPAVAAPSERPAPPVLLPPPAPPPGEEGGASTAAVLDCLVAGEGNPSYDRVHRSGRHFGRYGFDQPTWRGAVARAGYPEWSGRNPTEAPAHVQDAAAAQLYAERGSQPWPPSVGRC